MQHTPGPELQAFFDQHGVREVECIFPDISGYPRGKLMPARSFASGAELRIAQAIPMQCITGDYSYDPIFPDSDPDVRLVPDYRTLKLAPWSSTPRAFAIHKLWLSTRPGRGPVKSRRDRAQALALASLVMNEMKHLPFDGRALRMMPRDVVAAAIAEFRKLPNPS